MEIAARAPRRSRIEYHLRRSSQDAAAQAPPVQEREEEGEEEEVTRDAPESLLGRGEKDRAIMGRAHGLFHRRAEPSKVLTVIVDVVATVDSTGKLLGLATSTPVPLQVQDVPPPVQLPSVPPVPPFPSDLTVPAYPWPSGVPTALAASSPTVTPEPASAPSTEARSSPLPTPSTNFTSTTSISSSPSSESPSQTVVLVSTVLGPGGFEPATTAAPAETSAAAVSGGDSKSNTPLETPKVVGSVIGSLAGAAIFLALILFLIRRHKRRLAGGGAHRLPGEDAADSQPMASSGQQMATRSSSFPTGAAFLNRFSGASRSTADTSTTAGAGEKGFQRISGRKLPSAFSEGMTSEQFARDGTLSESSFYQDDKGFYGGPGLGTKGLGEGSAIGVATSGDRVISMPSPARTPTVHHPPPPFGESRSGGTLLSPPHSPNPSIPRGTLGRSHPSQDGSRNSRFTEDV